MYIWLVAWENITITVNEVILSLLHGPSIYRRVGAFLILFIGFIVILFTFADYPTNRLSTWLLHTVHNVFRAVDSVCSHLVHSSF